MFGWPDVGSERLVWGSQFVFHTQHSAKCVKWRRKKKVGRKTRQQNRKRRKGR